MFPLNEVASNHCICFTVFPASSTAFRTALAKLSFDSPTISMTFQTNQFTSTKYGLHDHVCLYFCLCPPLSLVVVPSASTQSFLKIRGSDRDYQGARVV